MLPISLDGCEYEADAREGRAVMKLLVVGERGQAFAKCVLEKRQGQWSVVSTNYEDAEGNQIQVAE
jgi:hypothetical protein